VGTSGKLTIKKTGKTEEKYRKIILKKMFGVLHFV
jgi:hypothetical protein